MDDSTSPVTRRGFSTGLLLAGAALGSTTESAVPVTEPFWYDRIRRLGQININEKDAATLDTQKWIDYWSSLKEDGLIVSCAGIIAFYPTQVPYHKRARFLGNRDLYGEFSKATRQAKMRVMARLHQTYCFP